MARKLFVVPLLPKPHYLALKMIWTTLEARQSELIVAAIELLVEEFRHHRERLEARLAAIRSRVPSEMEPL